MSINNLQDVIDSRDIIARIEELEAEREALAEEIEDAEGDCTAEVDALAEWDIDYLSELQALQALAAQGADYAADWEHGETLIRDSYFQDYAQELADDCGLIVSDAKWPNTCIDWEQAATELQMDYSSIDYDGITYWVR